LKQSHKGKLYHAEWDTRSRGSGEYADMLEKRYELALQRCGYPKDTDTTLNVDRFRMKPKSGEQAGFDF
jgi:DNA repair photolyase